MKSYKFLYTILFTITSFGFFACQKDTTNAAQEEVFKPNYTLAKTSNELMALRNDPTANLIKTLDQFDANVKGSPLAKLSKESLASFRSSLVVRDGVGIVSLKYGVLQESLNYDDFAIVLGMFGLDAKEGFWGFSQNPKVIQQLDGGSNKRLAGEGDDDTDDAGPSDGLTDYKGYACIVHKTCTKAKDYICMSGC